MSEEFSSSPKRCGKLFARGGGLLIFPQNTPQKQEARHMEDFTTTVRTLTEGLRDLPTDDVARVQHFLAEYLGDARHPVPFGGRERDFERLDTWLANRQAPPYLLLAAPAGRGKSALLLRWCRSE